VGYQLFVMPNRFKTTNEKLVNVGIEREKRCNNLHTTYKGELLEGKPMYVATR